MTTRSNEAQSTAGSSQTAGSAFTPRRSSASVSAGASSSPSGTSAHVASATLRGPTRRLPLPAEAVTEAVGLSPEDVERVYRDIEQKRRTTRYLHLSAKLLVPVEEFET